MGNDLLVPRRRGCNSLANEVRERTTAGARNLRKGWSSIRCDIGAEVGRHIQSGILESASPSADERFHSDPDCEHYAVRWIANRLWPFADEPSRESGCRRTACAPGFDRPLL